MLLLNILEIFHRLRVRAGQRLHALRLVDHLLRCYHFIVRQLDQRGHLGLHALPVPLDFCGLQCLKYGLQFLGIFLLLEKLRKPLKKNCTRGTIVLIMCLHDDKSLG